ncbi:hypothetical protein C8Q75DRAFT_695076, partial [Abortiporus biennis]
PVAFVDWFTPFGARDEELGMYCITRSTRRRDLYSSIIPITDIVQSCHLIPLFGKQ